MVIIDKVSVWHEMYCRDLMVMSSNPGRDKLWVHRTSVLICTWTKKYEYIHLTLLQVLLFSFLGPSISSTVDSAQQNLAQSFVNGFVNAAFGQDKLLMDEGNKWLYKNKEHGMLSATATLGLILLWDVDGGLTQIDKYLYSSEDY